MPKNIILSCTVISVEDLEKSKNFYMELFEEEIKFDFGRNIAFQSGLSLQKDFHWLTNIPEESLFYQSHTMEICYEILEFDTFVKQLKTYPDIAYIHDVIEYPWKQRVLRIYDPDKHIIEVSEAMYSVFVRFLEEGFSPEEISEMTEHPIELVLEAQKTKR